MADPVLIHRQVTSAAGAQANGDWFRVGGYSLSVQFVEAPAAEARVEVSQDRNTASVAQSGGSDLTGVGEVARPIDGLWQWARLCTEADAGGPRSFEAIFTIFKEST